MKLKEEEEREEEHRGYKRSGEEPEKRQLRPRIPATNEEFNPEWENLEVWEEDGNVQNKKYSRIGQLGRTSDKKKQGEESQVPTDQTPPCCKRGKPLYSETWKV